MGLEKRLGNEAFIAKAPAEVVEEQRQRLAELKATQTKLAQARAQLADL
jgi:valyl-tRNA synthetase